MPDHNGAMTMSEVISAWNLEMAQHRLMRSKYRALRTAARRHMDQPNMITKDILGMMIANDDVPEQEDDE